MTPITASSVSLYHDYVSSFGEGKAMGAPLLQSASSAKLKNLMFVIALCGGVVVMAVVDEILSGLIM